MNTIDGTQGKRPSTCYLSHGSTIYCSPDIDVEKIPSWSNHFELATHSDNTLTDRYNDMPLGLAANGQWGRSDGRIICQLWKIASKRHMRELACLARGHAVSH